jgi:hypothetical protein
MTTNSPFDHEPDREIGQLLREALTMGDEHEFVQRVETHAGRLFGQVPNGQWWSILGNWARPGVVAAAGLAAAALLWTGLHSGPVPTPASLANPIVESAAELPVPVWLADQTAPDVEFVFASASGF